MNIALKRVEAATLGTLYGCGRPENIMITGVETDSRKAGPGTLFVPLKGEKADGHGFIASAFGNGAACALSERKETVEALPGKAVILVDNALRAMGRLAKWYRSQMPAKVAAITGSVGKTSTKDMLASVLAQKYKTLKTEGNYNNEIGLPLSIFRLEPEHEYAVLEMGMNHAGEISRLSDIAQPDFCVITNIGITHIEHLGSRENIFKAKCEIFEHMKPWGGVILNGDDDLLMTLKRRFPNAVFAGFGAHNDVRAESVKQRGISGASFTLRAYGERIEINLPFPGEHMIRNTLTAAAMGYLAGLDTAAVKRGVESAQMSKMRLDIQQTPAGLTIINDAYNASPQSMEAALDVLKYAAGRKAAILGDMRELGELEEKSHREIGRYAAKSGIDLLVFIGSASKGGYEAAKAEGAQGNRCAYFETKEQFLKESASYLMPGDTVLVKASRGMAFEHVIKALAELQF